MARIEPYKDQKLPERFLRWIDALRIELQKTPNFTVGAGSPEGVVNGKVGDQYTRSDGAAGSFQYVKTTGTGNTGWQPIG